MGETANARETAHDNGGRRGSTKPYEARLCTLISSLLVGPKECYLRESFGKVKGCWTGLAVSTRLAGLIALRERGHAGSLQTARGWLEEEGDNMAASFCLSRLRVALVACAARAPYLLPRLAISARLLLKGPAGGDTRSAAEGCAGGGLHAGQMPANMRIVYAPCRPWNTARNVAISGSVCLACGVFVTIHGKILLLEEDGVQSATLRPSPRAFAYTTI